MKLFRSLYDLALRWAKHRHASYYLSGLSFAESSFFPIPPDVMLMPMSMAKPDRAMWYAAITTVASVLGGILGYIIGHYALEFVTPLISEGGHWASAYQRATAWFDKWGVWAIFLAGFSPIPYKIFTITAGAVAMSFIPFVLASAVGRGARFFLVASLLAWGGEKMERSLRHYIDRIGWTLVAIGIIAYVILKR